MSEKKAFVFDTNFIIQTRSLDEVIENLSDSFNVYVTQVSIDERIAQQCRELKTRFAEVERVREKNADIAEIKLKTTYDSQEKLYHSGVQRRYEDSFHEHIIPYAKDGAMLSAVLDRANKKIPPFLSDDKASDKGFKDALIWESMLAYFKDRGEQEVFLITDDGGFSKNSDFLCAEFREVTGKSISIHPNSYYRELLKPELVAEEKPDSPVHASKRPPNIEEIRDEIKEVIWAICNVEDYDYWGNERIVETFTINKEVDSTYMADVFEGLSAKIADHIFEIELSASYVLDIDGRVTDGERAIPIKALEMARDLYNEITKTLPFFLEQFYTATAKVINQNYRQPVIVKNVFDEFSGDDDLPF